MRIDLLKAAENIENGPEGLQSFIGKDATALYRVKMILLGLRMETKFPGMRMTRKAPSCHALAKASFGFKGTRPAVLAQMEALWTKIMSGEYSELVTKDQS